MMNIDVRSGAGGSLRLLGASLLLGLAVALVANGCESGGNEGDRCNALVAQDECDPGLHCTQVTCDRTYCCPTDRSSTEANCNGTGCPTDTDSGADDAATDAEPDATDAGDAGDP